VTDRETALRENRELWDEWTRIHETSAFYDLEGFKRGGIRLSAYELDEIGSVEGLDLLHLQCHFGIDTLSWARPWARVTGVDADGNPVDVSGEGLMAQALQHECDHLDGRLYIEGLEPDVKREAMRAIRSASWFRA